MTAQLKPILAIAFHSAKEGAAELPDFEIIVQPLGLPPTYAIKGRAVALDVFDRALALATYGLAKRQHGGGGPGNRFAVTVDPS